MRMVLPELPQSSTPSGVRSERPMPAPSSEARPSPKGRTAPPQARRHAAVLSTSAAGERLPT
jgi:hypothetical protein